MPRQQFIRNHDQESTEEIKLFLKKSTVERFRVMVEQTFRMKEEMKILKKYFIRYARILFSHIHNLAMLGWQSEVERSVAIGITIPY